jgi:hypothetical protein
MINWLDFKSIKRTVKLESVLRHYHVELRRSGKDQYRGCCPIHRGEGREAFHVNLARNVFHRFACDAGGTVLDFVAAIEGCSLVEAARKLQAMTCSSDPRKSTPDGKELVTKRRRVPLPLNFTLTRIDCSHPYLGRRGITEKTALEFGVGFYAGPGLMHGRLVIPIHNADGELIAYCGRSVDQTEPRYRLPSGFAKSEILFNMHRAAAGMENFVVLVEGFFDCMKVHQAGIRSVVGLMGSALYVPSVRPFWRNSAVSSSCWTAIRLAAKRPSSSPNTYGPTAASEWCCYQMVCNRISCWRKTSETSSSCAPTSTSISRSVTYLIEATRSGDLIVAEQSRTSAADISSTLPARFQSEKILDEGIEPAGYQFSSVQLGLSSCVFRFSSVRHQGV